MKQVKRYYQSKSLHYGMSGLRQRYLLKVIGPINGKSILDIGCASGYFGRQLKLKNNRVIGIDISLPAIKKAKKVLDRAYCLDVEASPLPFKEKFDLIILTEVLEHLFQPEQTIKRLLRFLKPRGQIVISTPNISFLPHRLRFLMGKFTYSDQGVFDVSHIHFFNYSSLKQILKLCRLSVRRENHLIFPQTFNQLLKAFPNLFAYQLILLAERSKTGLKNQ